MFLDVAAVHIQRLRLFDLILDNWINSILLPEKKNNNIFRICGNIIA